jgi:hypothetical protein
VRFPATACAMLLLGFGGLTIAPSSAASAAGAAFVDLPQLVRSHPLHRFLDQYDSEIAALSATRGVAGLGDPAAMAQSSAAALQTDVSAAAAHAEAIGKRDAGANRAREQAAITQLLRSEHTADSEKTADTKELASETDANVRAYGEALSESAERAYAAREQQLREKELTLAYDLEGRDAGRRLTLRLKLDDLHLTSARRARLRAALAALDAGEFRAVSAMRSADAIRLATYRAQLEESAAASEQMMVGQLRSKAGANYVILARVFHEAANEDEALPPPSQLAAFTGGYAAPRDGQTIASGMRASGDDLSQRFRQIAAVDARSQGGVATQLRILKAARDALYRSIVAQIRAEALTLARQRGLGSVEFVSAAPKTGGLDFTPTVAAHLARLN